MAVHRHAAVALSLAIAAPAAAMTRVASDGNTTVSALEVAIEEDAWIVRVRLEGNARQVALFFPAPAGEARLVEASLLDDLDHATAPRIEVFDATDPCAAAEAKPLEPIWPERKSESPAGFSAALVDRLALGALALDDAGKTALARSLREGKKLAVLSGPAPGKLRGFWTPSIRIAAKSRSLPIGLVAPQITVGRDLHVDLYLHGPLAPKQKSADLPAGIFLPEVAAEDPLDLLRAATSQTIRREGRGTAIRIHSGERSRWSIDIGRKDERAVLELEERQLAPFVAKWMIRKAWRKTIACADRERYKNIIRIQQKNEIQTYAAITGRPQATIEGLMKERGYLLSP